MSIINNKDYNGLELGAQRRTNFEFNLTSATPVVIRVTSTCCYRVLARAISIHEGSIRYDIVINPTVVTEGTDPVRLYRTNRKVSTETEITLTSGWAITYDSADRDKVVDRAVADAGKKNDTPPPPDFDLGGRIFTEADVFYLVLTRRGNDTARGFLNLLIQERLLSA